ncbi:MAG TPA: VOC family protein [Candidatus Elarobacter sp.]|nr:VOC family protein [Candidatus Elarobacter sp.]
MSSFVESSALATVAATRYQRIDHIAFAVRDLEAAIEFFGNVVGFELIRRLETRGKRTGMLSAEMECNGIKFVLCQGTEPESQVSKLIEHFGAGVAHVALAVDDVGATVAELKERGLKFDTSVITGPGLQQAFSSRDSNSGLAFEFIHREGEDGFLSTNVQDLFDQLENSGSY